MALHVEELLVSVVLERLCKGAVMVDVRDDQILDVEIVLLRIKRRKRAGRLEQDISPSMYASAKHMSWARRLRGQADGE